MSRNIKGITIEIGGNTQPLQKALQDVNKNAREMQGELRQVERLLKLDPKNTELLAQKQQLLTDAVANTSNKLETLKEAQRQVQEQFERGEIGAEQYRAIQREVIATEQNLQSLQRQLNEVNNGWKNAAENLEKFGKKSTEAGKDLTKKVTAPILGVGAAAAKIGMDFEAGMSEVQAISGATGEQLEQLEDAAREMGSKTSKSAKDAADALKYMALAGWDVETSMKGLEPVLRLSEAGSIDLGRASDLVTDSMSAMGIAVDDLNIYLDKVAKTQSKANTSADGMLEAYVSAGGTLKNLNTDLDTSATLIGVLANRGIKGSEAGNKLNATLVNLSGSTDKTRKIFDELGIAIYDQEGAYIGIEKVLEGLKGKFDGMTESERNYYMAQLVGKTQIDTMSALLDGLGNEYYDLKSEIENADGALLTMAKTMQDNNKGSITALLSALEELALKIYDVIAPAIADFIDKLQSVVNWLNNLSPKMQTTIVAIAGLVAAIGPLLIIVGQMALGLSALITFFTGTTVAAGATTTAVTGATTATTTFGSVIAAITGPIGIAIAAIVAITAVVVALWKTNEEFREAMKLVWESVKLIIESAINLIKAVIQGFIAIFTGDWNKLKESIATIWNSLWTILGESIYASTATIINIIAGLIKNITKLFTDIAKDAFSWGKNMINGFIDGIKSMIGKVKNAVSSVTSAVSGYLGFNSPAKEGEGRHIVEWGYNMIDGFMEGMNKALPELQKSLNTAIPNLGKLTNTTNNSTLNNNNSFIVNAVIREDQDIRKVAQELHRLQQQNSRGRGILV